MNYGNSFDMLNLSSQAVQGQLFFNIDTEELFVFGENTDLLKNLQNTLQNTTDLER